MLISMSRCFGVYAAGACLTIALTLLTAGQSAGQDGRTLKDYITEASGRLAELMDKAAKQKYTLQDNTFTTGGAWIKIHTVAQ